MPDWFFAMKALVKSKREPGLWLEEIPKPTIGINDVLIRVLRAGICGTDLHIYNWDEWAQRTIPVPMAIGHEFVGEIVEIGSNVNDFHPGDIVSGEGHVVCGRCRNCLAGRRHLCAHTMGVGVNRPGAFADFIAVPMTNIWRHKETVDLDVAAIFDPFGNAVHTALSFPVLGEDVLITGAGPIGIMSAAVVPSRGSASRGDHRQESVPAGTGAQNGRDAGGGYRANIAAGGAEGARHAGGLRCGAGDVGKRRAFREMIANMSHGAKIAMLGIPAKEISIDWTTVVFNMLTIKGIYGREMYETWYKMTVMLESGLDIRPVITHRFPYQDFEQGFEAMRSGNTGKVILEWST